MLTNCSAMKIVLILLLKFSPYIFGMTIVLVLLLAIMLRIANTKQELLEKIFKWFVKI